MRGKWALLALIAVILTASVALADDNGTGGPPATLDRFSGNRVLSYALFGTLALLTVLLIYRGVRSR